MITVDIRDAFSTSLLGEEHDNDVPNKPGQFVKSIYDSTSFGVIVSVERDPPRPPNWGSDRGKAAVLWSVAPKRGPHVI